MPCPRVIQQTLEMVRIHMDQWNRDGLAVSAFLSSLVDEDENTPLSHLVSPKRCRPDPSKVLGERNTP